MLLKSPCHRLGELTGRMQHRKELLMPFETVRAAAAAVHSRVILHYVQVVVRAKIEFDEFGKLTDFRGKVTPETEVAYVDKGHTAVAVQLYSGLVSPKVRRLVEIPVGSARPVFSKIIPVLSVQGLPNGLEGKIVLEIFGSLVQSHRHFHLKALVVSELEGGLLQRGREFEQLAVRVIERIVLYDIAAGPKAYKRIAAKA